MKLSRLLTVAGLLFASVITLAHPVVPQTALGRALRNISECSLRGNLSFLASDALAGRWTPSPGLDVAAEFLASRFRAAGVEPGNGQSYFQNAEFWAGHVVKARNVIAVLRGSDPVLRNTYVVLSAHYDHIGTLATAGKLLPDRSPRSGDTIFNGANDDGSGTVSVIEIAKALKTAHYHPRRTIVFLLFCGEELGERGSEYYVEHPVYPLQNTVADINLEQVGRSDSDFGKEHASLTGYDYTTMAEVFERAAKPSGFTLVKTQSTDAYFKESDNYNFAKMGIPDVTFATAFYFPDYHGLKDEWTKIDFPDMVRADRLVVRVLMEIASSRHAPQWNAGNPKTKEYRHAAEDS